MEVPFLQHFCPFFFITVTVATLLISWHVSLHYQLWWWGWWWMLFTAGILWKARQMNNNYSNRYTEAKKGEWLKWGYYVRERQRENFFWRGFGSCSSIRGCPAELAGMAYPSNQCVLIRTEGKTMNYVYHKTNVYSCGTLASSVREGTGLSLTLCSKNNQPPYFPFHPSTPKICYLSIYSIYLSETTLL